ncbi:hypothetical protein PVAND_002001 [Polypedilum vanderplanki]|uniref:Uncharacterized protein n=1 Tax=Polypedilum vanderplanki TaxID=319348 RepID=A0A9J6BPZ2_POLVA|nr:hypothetical protein PVAND_002001 [Polypedilum vanderplanki]
MKVFIFCLFLISCVLAKSPPKWESVYKVKGYLFIPYAEIEEPFSAWYDEPTGRSRIDYYGGTVKTYQLKHEGQYGTSLKFAPITTNDFTNKEVCLQVNGTGDYHIDVQAILPNVKNFTLLDTVTFRGYQCDRFVYSETIGQKKNDYMLYVRYVKSPKFPASLMPIPVRYDMKGYNTLLGSHIDHYYLMYDSYSHEDIPNDVFDVELSDCQGFPGPGNRHFATMNPMKEFVYPNSEEHLDDEFERFKSKHDKDYDTHHEHENRKNIFRQNLRFIHSMNRKGLGYSLGVNHLADRTADELRALRGFKSSKIYNGGRPFPYDIEKEKDHLPDQYDWRLYGAVTPVKDQSVCGSCWSFGTIGAIEGAYFLNNGNKLVRLSQQALIDCSWGYGNNGCDGGEDFRAYQWMMKVGGVPTEESYGSYLGQDGYCHINNATLVAPIKGFVNVTSNNENAFKIALYKNGPLSIAIDASKRTFSFYSHGVYYDESCGNTMDDLDHAVLAVGYGTMNGEVYFLIKNSWSTYWGNDGYALMSARNNNCGIMTDATYVLM